MKIESAFQTWFEAQHGERQKHTNVTDRILQDQAMAGTRAQAELLRRSEWDARYQSALYAWQAAGGDTIVSFVPEKTIEKVNLGFVADRSGAVFTELLDSVLAEDDPAEAGTVVEAKDGAVAEYGGEDAPEDPPEKCPDCGQMTVVPKSSGIACTDPKCGYWFCA